MPEIKYVPPAIWTSSTGHTSHKFLSINRDTSGPQHAQTLPRGSNPIQLYSMNTPNGIKVSIMLEELLELGISDAKYDAHLIEITKGDQFSTGFCQINPNSKIPAIVDTNGVRDISVFESGAILLYLAEKFGRLISPEQRASCLSWLFWQVGSAPYLGGGFGHFFHYAEEKLEYPIDRYTMEVKRQLHLLNTIFKGSNYLCGESYTIADIATWSWYGILALDGMYEAQEFLNIRSYPFLQQWAERIASRPAVQRGRLIFNS